jgi:AraC-like DNA-binding protein
MESGAAPASVNAWPTWASGLFTTPKATPGHHLRRNPSAVSVSRGPSAFHADAIGRRAFGRIPSEGAEAPGDEFGYSMPAHRVREIARLAIRHGWDIEGALRAVGMPPPSLGQRYPRITRKTTTAVLQHLWRTTNDELLGTGPKPLPLGTFRLVAFALCSAPNLSTALERFGECRSALPGVPAVVASSSDGATALSIDVAGFTEPVDLLADVLLAWTHRAINWAIRRPLCLRRVELPHRRPRGNTDYHLMFGAPVEFSASRAALIFDSAALSEPIVRDQEEVETFLRDSPSGIIAQFDFYSSHSDRVRRIIEARLGGRGCTADEIAAGVGMSRQTLRRRLREENTSVTDIKEDVLRGAAMASLAKGDETIAALSERLGFSEPSAFTRAFRRWTGEPPTRYRHAPAAARELVHS